MGRDGSSSWLWMGGRSALRSVQPIHYRSRNREENFLFNPLVIPLINVRKNTISMNNNDFDHKETEGYCVVYVHFNQEFKFSRSSLSKYSKIKKKKIQNQLSHHSLTEFLIWIPRIRQSSRICEKFKYPKKNPFTKKSTISLEHSKGGKSSFVTKKKKNKIK